MAYMLGQYNEQSRVDSDNTFMTLVTEGTTRRRQATTDSGVSGNSNIFYNECVQCPTLSNNSHYYFHGKIKRMMSDQVFYIKLVNYNNLTLEQYIKTITIASGDSNDWVDVEFTFTPFVAFDTILFDMQRTVEDYTIEARVPIIIYEELSVINNIIPRKIANDVALIKMGVQSRPGLLMCINGEEIRTCKTGIYELKSGNILVDFFSVVTAADEANSALLPAQITEINNAWNNATTQADKMAIESRCLFSSSKIRTISGFTVDYMYREE